MARYSRNLTSAPKNSFVTEPPSNLHPFVAAWIEGTKWDELSAFSRHLARTYDALAKAVERRGHCIERENTNYLFPARFFIHGERIDFHLKECVRRPKVALTPKELRDPDNIARKKAWKYVDVCTGTLILEAHAAYYGMGATRWAEKPDRALEEYIDEIVLKLETIAVMTGEQRAKDLREKERRERRQADREQSYRVEDERWEAARVTVAAWEEAQQLRRLIDAVGRQAPKRTDQIKRLNKWLRWARARADRLDPFTKSFDSILTGLGMEKR